ncbi:uncharacterized protein [Oryza sativa Japonica Group]|nr:uncharacterized protein LOC4330901 isoform X1 [Oryza sativa Japonica Group]XP_015625820.1 uncharacterized protein LOC4330901 isoform X1 [Oryza sativa Japonica Group]XP_015625822.1 uncharacterized protein LOC4330901 isoform X1 [Oryza sativa Japonica Group]XP_015625823.1 uncharacterized protein LOC4330901 isoform X1 [Oryza sativa Japonica Group]XP_015625824.1 uncharacterized protein LOC4330901 isoform X1 [Oryza sativa Japonica Group]KAF2947224.1 hypothetical protein DAI22_02g353800 [Oryza sat
MEVGGPQDALDNRSDDNDFDKNDNSDPVVYQLVRVEGDGTLIPATEDEVLQFETFLHDEKVDDDLPSIDDVTHVEEYFTNDCIVKKPEFEEGPSKLDTADVQTQKLDAGLEEDRLCTLNDSIVLPSNCSAVHDQQLDKLNTEQGANIIAQQDNASTETTKSTVLNDLSSDKEKADACSKPVNEASAGQSVSGVTSSVPDFSILKGEVCLDDLTMRELQEAFRATFGRQTTVKDKLWLKRRIAMGLINSCDVPSSGCVVRDYKVIAMGAKQEIPVVEAIPKMELEANLVRDQVMNPGHERDLPSSLSYHSEEQQRSSKRLKRVPTDNDEPQVTIFAEQGTTKRIRKPTKRYIEELSDIDTHESTGRLSSPGKRHVYDEVLLRPRIAPLHEVDSLSTAYPTREDTLGGCSVHVPYVSRMRRGRPRSNFIPFLDPEPSVECTEAPAADVVNLEKEGERKNHQKNTGKKGVHVETSCEKDVQGLQDKDFCDSDDNPKTKRGGKRKHHRAWTLCEVVKLVDGVARYGAGKWSEIRRLAFSSYSYRTSVDLKDKWRNLIRASQTQLSTENDGVCPRKSNPSAIPIPVSILLRVKKLAEMQSQAGDVRVPIKFSGQSTTVVQGKVSGFL